MKDGRSKAPPLPEGIYDEMLTRLVNQVLLTNYTVEEIANKPRVWLEKVKMIGEFVG